jgi:hypothetical protein
MIDGYDLLEPLRIYDVGLATALAVNIRMSVFHLILDQLHYQIQCLFVVVLLSEFLVATE